MPPVTRRRALAGAAAAALGLTAGTAAHAAAGLVGGPLGPNDARLVALADQVEALEAACDAHTAEHRGRATDASDDAFELLAAGFGPLEDEIGDTPADSMAGVLAKARAAQVRTMRAFGECSFALSLADDVWRLLGGVVA